MIIRFYHMTLWVLNMHCTVQVALHISPRTLCLLSACSIEKLRLRGPTMAGHEARVHASL